MTIIVRYVPLHRQYRNLSRSGKMVRDIIPMIGACCFIAFGVGVGYQFVLSRDRSATGPPAPILYAIFTFPIIVGVGILLLCLSRLIPNARGKVLCSGEPLPNWSREFGTNTHLRDNVMNVMDPDTGALRVDLATGQLIVEIPILHDVYGNEITIPSAAMGLSTVPAATVVAMGIIGSHPVPPAYVVGGVVQQQQQYGYGGAANGNHYYHQQRQGGQQQQYPPPQYQPQQPQGNYYNNPSSYQQLQQYAAAPNYGYNHHQHNFPPPPPPNPNDATPHFAQNGAQYQQRQDGPLLGKHHD